MATLQLALSVSLSLPVSANLNRTLSLPTPRFSNRNRLYYCKCSNLASARSIKTSSIPPLQSLQPHVVSEWQPILIGWSCGALSVYALSKLVPQAGTFPSLFSCGNGVLIRNQIVVGGFYFLIRLIASYWQQTLLWKAALSAVYKIRTSVFERVLQRDMAFFEDGNSISAGDISYRVTSEAADVADALYYLLNASVPNTLHLFVIAAHMFKISPVLSLISALAIPCVAIVIACLGEKLRKISRRAKVTTANISAYLNEVFPSILFVKAGNLEVCEHARFHHLADADLCEQLRKKRIKSLIPQIVQIMFFGGLSVLCVCCIVVSKGLIDGCGIISFVTSLFLLIEPIQGVEKAYNEWKQVEPAVERLFSLTRFLSNVNERPDAVKLDNVIGDLKFCNISFRYKENMPFILDGLDLHINAGETVAFVGPSGGGKTTLIKLLLRLYDPMHGHILVDNHNIQTIQLQNLRTHIALVSQDVILFSGTIAENIGYRDLMRSIDMDEVEHAAKTANADEFIRCLPHGYNTRIGQRGSSLSGGQKQRIAIARALYQKSSILVLDEATSALDSRSELLVRQAVERVMKDHTVLVIAHRAETVQMANRVFLLENGKLRDLPRSSLFPVLNGSTMPAGLVI